MAVPVFCCIDEGTRVWAIMLPNAVSAVSDGKTLACDDPYHRVRQAVVDSGSSRLSPRTPTRDSVVQGGR